MKLKVGFVLILVSLLASACIDSDVFDPVNQFKNDTTAIATYLKNKNITAIKHATGVYIEVKELGNGLPALTSNKVNVEYVGKLLSTGQQFDAGTWDGALSETIAGWQIAFSLLPVGSKATVYIPSFYAYQNQSKQSIPANSILVFDVVFKEVRLTSTEKSRFTQDTTAINNYLSSKQIDQSTLTKDVSGLKYQITEFGVGPTPNWFSKIKIKYSIKNIADDSKWVVENKEFEPVPVLFDSYVVDHIHAIKVAARNMKAGSRATLYIPSRLAYGASTLKDETTSPPQTLLPANANLIMQFELVEVKE